MPFFAAPSLTYYYESYGAGPTLLLLHGFTGNAQNWAFITEALKANHHLIAIDLPGHGRSAAPDTIAAYTMPSVATDITALLDHLDIARAHLLGYSMGGRLALYLALQYASRWSSLILESASPGLPTARERRERVARDEALAAFIEEQGIEPFVDRWEKLPLFSSQQCLPRPVRQAHRASRLNNHAHGLASSLRGMGTGVQPSLWEHLDKLQAPVLLIAGSLDPKFVDIGRKMSGQTPDARLEIVSDAGHTVHLEQPRRYLELLTAWLAEHA